MGKRLFRPIILTMVSSSLALCVNSALGDEKPVPDGRIDMAAIYFPGYHRDMHYDTWFGDGWNEWKLLMEAHTHVSRASISSSPSGVPLTRPTRSGWNARSRWPPIMASPSSSSIGIGIVA